MNKRGISPVIATVLLIAIVVVIATIIFIWASNFVGEDIEKFGSSIKNACVDVDLEVSEITPGYLNIINRGQVPVFAVNLKVDDGSGNSEISKCTGSFSPGQTGVLNIGNDCDASGEVTVISVIPVLVGTSGDENKEYACEKNQITL
ncbi:MAG: archaellin/type IV pilin N-terminal domain-containing protein [Nanoarchaeota archaeon]